MPLNVKLSDPRAPRKDLKTPHYIHPLLTTQVTLQKVFDRLILNELSSNISVDKPSYRETLTKKCG
jgi:hypothetical protein